MFGGVGVLGCTMLSTLAPCVAPAGGAGAAGAVAVLRAGPARPHLSHSLRGALAGARERFGTDSCQRLLNKFSDASGRPLRARLESLGATPRSYLDLIYFRDGNEHPTCRRPGIAALTAPGSRVVLVCRQLEDLARGRRHVAEAILIHEALHTLGLGENPPTSSEITAEVLRGCSRP